jgi:hypothetical protein
LLDSSLESLAGGLVSSAELLSQLLVVLTVDDDADYEVSVVADDPSQGGADTCDLVLGGEAWDDS